MILARTKSNLYLVMRYLSGGTLKERLDQGPLAAGSCHRHH